MDPTQAAGFLAYSMAGLACAAARRRIFWSLGVVNFLLAIECVVQLRAEMRKLIVVWVGEAYRQREPYQWFLLAAVLIISLAIVVILKASLAKRAAHVTPAIMLTLASLLLFAIELVSLHGIDAAIYHRVGPLLVLGWIWLFLGSGTAFSAYRAARIVKKAQS